MRGWTVGKERTIAFAVCAVAVGAMASVALFTAGSPPDQAAPVVGPSPSGTEPTVEETVEPTSSTSAQPVPSRPVAPRPAAPRKSDDDTDDLTERLERLEDEAEEEAERQRIADAKARAEVEGEQRSLAEICSNQGLGWTPGSPTCSPPEP